MIFFFLTIYKNGKLKFLSTKHQILTSRSLRVLFPSPVVVARRNLTVDEFRFTPTGLNKMHRSLASLEVLEKKVPLRCGNSTAKIQHELKAKLNLISRLRPVRSDARLQGLSVQPARHINGRYEPAIIC